MARRNAFKNFWRVTPINEKIQRQSAGRKEDPPSKRLKVCMDEGQDLDEEEYQEAVEKLQAEFKKGHNKAPMEKTRKRQT